MVPGRPDLHLASGPAPPTHRRPIAAASTHPAHPRGGGGRNRGGGGRHSFIDPVLPVEYPETLAVLAQYYGLGAEFPLSRQLVTRSADRRPKRLYFVSESVLDLLIMDKKEQLKIIATGLKVGT